MSLVPNTEFYELNQRFCYAMAIVNRCCSKKRKEVLLNVNDAGKSRIRLSPRYINFRCIIKRGAFPTPFSYLLHRCVEFAKKSWTVLLLLLPALTFYLPHFTPPSVFVYFDAIFQLRCARFSTMYAVFPSPYVGPVARSLPL